MLLVNLIYLYPILKCVFSFVSVWKRKVAEVNEVEWNITMTMNFDSFFYISLWLQKLLHSIQSVAKNSFRVSARRRREFAWMEVIFFKANQECFPRSLAPLPLRKMYMHTVDDNAHRRSNVERILWRAMNLPSKWNRRSSASDPITHSIPSSEHDISLAPAALIWQSLCPSLSKLTTSALNITTMSVLFVITIFILDAGSVGWLNSSGIVFMKFLPSSQNMCTL